MTLRAYGLGAEAYAASLPERWPLIVSDAEGAAHALAEGVERRSRGERFFFACALQEPRADVAMALSARLCVESPDRDALRVHLDALSQEQLTVNGVPQRNISTITEPARLTLRDLARISDGLFARSYREATKVRAILGIEVADVVVAPVVDASLASVRRGSTTDAFVVWAPSLTPEQAALFAFALDEWDIPVIVACREAGRVPHLRATFVRADPLVLERAHAVLDAEVGSPATAIALARSGFPLAVASTSGAAEYLRNCAIYDPWDWKSILRAAAIARGSSPALERHAIHQREPDAVIASDSKNHVALGVTDRRPLVSVILPTYNRRDLLPRSLDSMARQTYRSFEVVLVDNGGEPVQDIADRYSFVRRIRVEQNRGCCGGFNIGLDHACGEYVMFLTDDDRYFPNALEDLVASVKRAGTKVAHGNTVVRFIDQKNDGSEYLKGYRVMFSAVMNRTDLLYEGELLLPAGIYEKSIFDELGKWDESIPQQADYELLVRISRKYDFAYVDRPIFEFSYRMRGTTLSHAEGGEGILRSLLSIYDRYPSNSRFVAERRAAMTAFLQSHRTGPLWEPYMALR
jgi:hypothetical protein